MLVRFAQIRVIFSFHTQSFQRLDLGNFRLHDDMAKGQSHMKNYAGSLTIAFLALSGSLLAHHGTAASYDSTKTVTITGTLTKFSWTNPHSYVELDVKAADGQTVHWAGELSSPLRLQTAGWTKNTIRAGDQITLTLHPSKAGTPVGEVDRSKPIIVNGKELLPASNEE
jgi:hypothetical protein